MKPMLSATVENYDELNGKFPLMASPKLDGVRALIVDGQVVSRNMKPIPNLFVQRVFNWLPEGFDGELIVGKPTDKDCFRNTTSGVMSVEGEPDVYFYVFDKTEITGTSFSERFAELKNRVQTFKAPGLKFVPHKLIKDSFKLKLYEEEMLEKGYEGVMLRSIEGPYKFGRSTLKEGYLMKVKQFKDSEAIVKAMIELEHNENELTKDELGRAKRSSHKAGKVKAGVLGSILVRDIYSGVEFNIGAGFMDDERERFWEHGLVGKTIKYKYFPTGSKDKPRFPVFLGIREDL